MSTLNTSILNAELLEQFDASIADVADALTMPPAIYTSAEFLAFEQRALFAAEWLCVGRSSRIPGVGDYFTTTVNDEQIIVSRAKDATVRAFSAICQHRGMQVADDAGNCSKFTCPYHLWSYDLTGRLLGAPAMERTTDFDKGDFPLPPLKVELWQGFIFVHFDLEAAPLAPTLADYLPYATTVRIPNPPPVVPAANVEEVMIRVDTTVSDATVSGTAVDFCPSESF